jgi:hypothetical protein
MVDIEADGPIPGDNSMIEIGAVIVKEPLTKKFYGTLKPLPNASYSLDALNSIGKRPEETLNYDDPYTTMTRFAQWIGDNSKGKPQYVSDNNGFDFMFTHWYFIHFLGRDPFGYSSTSLGSLYKGLMQDVFINFKHLRKTVHTHNPVDDAMGNAEALLTMKKQFPDFKISLD